MTIEFIVAFLVMGTWPGYAIYMWTLTFLPMVCYLLLLLGDAKREPKFVLESMNEYDADGVHQHYM